MSGSGGPVLFDAVKTGFLGQLNRLQKGLTAAVDVRGLASMPLGRQRSMILRSHLFDAAYYLKQCEGDGDAPADPAGHYLTAGERAGKRPNHLFDRSWYAARHTENEARDVNQFLHYVALGRHEGRAPGPAFDPDFYRRTYPEVAALHFDPLGHYLEHGRFEGRVGIEGQARVRPGDWFDVVERHDLGVFDAASPSAVAFLKAYAAAAGPPVTLHILHSGGGGTERHLAERILAAPANEAHAVLFTHQAPGGLELSFLLARERAWSRFDFKIPSLEDLALILKRLSIARVHIHQAREILIGLEKLLDGLGAPFDISIHDYSLLCPRNSFSGVDGRYCGEPGANGCAVCLNREPRVGADIVVWRRAGLSLINRAANVFCPTRDVAERIRRYAPAARIEMAPPPFAGGPARRAGSPAGSSPVRVAVMGHCSEHKGGDFLLDCVEAALASDTKIDWTVIGSFGGSVVKRARRLRNHLHVTGAYDSRRLDSLLDEARPDLLFFPQHCVETYSYALSEALASGLPILAPDLGAFPERLSGVAHARLYDQRQSPAEVMTQIARGTPAKGPNSGR
jgi:glycosyltransferase involved in cell wall biosynthesis